MRTRCRGVCVYASTSADSCICLRVYRILDAAMRIATFDPASDFFFIAGPCLVEGEEMMRRTAGHLSEIAARYNVPLILKGSFRKANRTSVHSIASIGDEPALTILANAGAEF